MRFKQVKIRHITGNYRQYSPTSMTNAYLAVKDRELSLRGAARKFGVPVMSLQNRVKGTVSIDVVKSGRAPVFSNEEEAHIVKHLQEMAQLGYGYTRAEVVDIANDYATILGKRTKDNPLTMRWYQTFMSRWDQELRLVKPRSLEIQRAKAANIDNARAYFNELDQVIKKYHLTDKPHLIFNVDEKGIQQNHSPPSVVAGRSISVQEVTSQKSSTTTILGCGSAAGVAIPPFFVFAGARMRQELLQGGTPGVDGTVSESGWSNSAIFREYLQDHFLKHAPGRGDDPILLLLDGHKSHVSVGMVDWAREHNIILFILPAHTSHFLQPLDVGCYGPFHRIYNNECHKLNKTLSAVITKHNICEVACRAYTKALSQDNLRNAFKRTGIFPLDQSAINNDYLLPATAFNSSTELREDQENTNYPEKEKNGTQEKERNSTSNNKEVEPRAAGDMSMTQNDDDTIQKPGMTGDFLVARVDQLKKVKSEMSGKDRKTMSKITSGHCITEGNIREMMIQHNEGINERSTKQKRKQPSQGKKTKNPKKIKQNGDSQKAGPSKETNQTRNQEQTQDPETADTDSEEEIEEKDKCCICKLYTPKEVRESTSLIFTKWVACDKCPHWVHLIYCTKERVVRKGDEFICAHCK